MSNHDVLLQSILSQLTTMRAEVNETLAKQQARYTRYLHKKIWILSSLTVGQMVSVNGPPLNILSANR